MNAKTDTWMPLYVADYQSDTSRLTLEQHGAYLLLIMDYWRNGPPPDDDNVLARILGVERRAWLKLRPTVSRFFRIEDGEWRHGRIDREVEAATNRKQKAGARAKAAAEARWGRCSEHAPSMPQAMQEDMLATCPPPSPTPNGVISEANASSVASAAPNATGGALALVPTEPEPSAAGEPWDRDPDFAKLWEVATPQARKRAKSKAKVWPEWQRAKRLALPTAIVAGYVRYKAFDPDVGRSGGPGLHIWLRDRTWESWAKAPDQSADWTEGRWRAALRIFTAENLWDEAVAGPKPGATSCRVPPAILREFGIEPAQPQPVARTA